MIAGFARCWYVAMALMVLACGAAWGRTSLVVNGSMDAGGDAPSEWKKTDDIAFARDTEVFLKGPASLRVSSDGKDGNANQTVTDLAGRTVRIAGHVKRDDSLENVQVFTLTFDKDWQNIGWTTVFAPPKGEGWQAFEKTQEFPANAGAVLFGLFVKGQGSAWLDEVSITEVDAEASRRRLALDAAAKYEIQNLDRFDGAQPKLLHVGAVAPDILCMQIREKEPVWGTYTPYEAQDGDEIVEQDRTRTLKRGGNTIGWLGGPEDAPYLRTQDRLTGKPLQLRYLLDPQSYTISGPGDLSVDVVYRKAKPTAYVSGPGGIYAVDHMVFLQLTGPMQVGGEYEIGLGQINLDQASVSYKHDPRTVRTEAVHVSQVGFRPDDPAKIGWLSTWLGTGGGYSGYREGMAFELIDQATGECVFTGRTTLRMPQTQVSYGLHAKGRNFPGADVYQMDFSGFTTPGQYVLSVEGVGCSYPFRIARDAWEKAALTSLRGFYHQRSGTAFEKPYADYERPRDFHPDDGNVFYELDISELEFSTTLGDGNLEALLEHKTDRVIPNAWGGTHDAGDYDRRAKHLVCSRYMMELLELFPEYYAGLKLPIPEAANDIPDILDEALWNLDLYRRIQREDGAVRGGIETNGHPKQAECCWTDTLTKMVFAPDIRASWEYVATAAQAAHCLASQGWGGLAEMYADSALKAMQWAEAEYTQNAAKYEAMNGWWRTKDTRNLAALMLYRITEDRKWHGVFEQTCGFKDTEGLFRWGDYIQRDAALFYALLDDDLADDAIRQMAVKGIRKEAEFQIEYADKQAFMWTANDLGTPLILSVPAAPQGQSLCRAHRVTGESRYLDWAIRTTQFSVGANPANMTYTTGLGHRRPEYPLFVDYHVMALDKAPTGLTLYGILDPVFSGTDWGFTWIQGKFMEPNFKQWPLFETYCDVYHWPMQCEYTVEQSMAPALYVWGYLAGRP